MPELARFLGIVIGMFYREHGVPHFHAVYGEVEISVEVESGTIHGQFPPRALKLVVSETAAPSDTNPTGAVWNGMPGWPGLAVIARHGLSLEPHPANQLSPPLMAGFRVRGHVDFNLLAVWPVQREGGLRYAQTLHAGLERYSDLLSDRAIMAGDLNSSTKVSGQ